MGSKDAKKKIVKKISIYENVADKLIASLGCTRWLHSIKCQAFDNELLRVNTCLLAWTKRRQANFGQSRQQLPVFYWHFNDSEGVAIVQIHIPGK